MRRKKWLTGVLTVASVLVALAGTGLMGPRAQRAVEPALDVLVGPAEARSVS